MRENIGSIKLKFCLTQQKKEFLSHHRKAGQKHEYFDDDDHSDEEDPDIAKYAPVEVQLKDWIDWNEEPAAEIIDAWDAVDYSTAFVSCNQLLLGVRSAVGSHGYCTASSFSPVPKINPVTTLQARLE
jgi:hypothetical protein